MFRNAKPTPKMSGLKAAASPAADPPSGSTRGSRSRAAICAARLGFVQLVLELAARGTARSAAAPRLTASNRRRQRAATPGGSQAGHAARLSSEHRVQLEQVLEPEQEAGRPLDGGLPREPRLVAPGVVARVHVDRELAIRDRRRHGEPSGRRRSGSASSGSGRPSSRGRCGRRRTRRRSRRACVPRRAAARSRRCRGLRRSASPLGASSRAPAREPGPARRRSP